MSNFRSLTEHDLAAFAENIVTLLAGTELSAIESHVRADLIAAFGTLPATLVTQTDAAVVSEDVRKSNVSERNDTTFQIQGLIARLRDALKSGQAPKNQYDLVGLNYPFTTRSKIIAQDPTGLSATGASNGVNRLTFTGNNKPSKVSFEIWRREGDSGEWKYIAATKRQSFTDKPVTPGQYYEYKVKAVAATTMSNWSNSAVVYGIL